MADLRPMESRMVFTPSKTKRMDSRTKRKVIKEINMKKCRYCHSTENLTLDHKLPLAKGGSNERKNLQCLCQRCNMMKSDLSQMEVRRLFDWFTWITISKVHNDKVAKRKKKDDLSN